ncbi:hypothetical protein ABPG75_005829 [Micractinium tetrahymenae]
MESNEFELLAKRFGGSRIARLAAQQALLSRQASTETGTAPSNESSSAGAQAAQPEQHQPEDDEALLLSRLMNRPEHTGGWVPHRSQAARRHEPEPAASSRVNEPKGVTDEQSALSEAPEAGSVISERAARTPSPPAPHSFGDAAEEDTVLTGSPVGIPSSSGRSSTAEPAEGAEAAGSEQALDQAGDISQPAVSGAHSDRGHLATAAAATAAAAQVAVSPGLSPVPPRAATPQQAMHVPADRLQCTVSREAIRQRQWSFADIPQGTASIPSKAAAGGGQAGAGGSSSKAALGAAAAGTAALAPRPAFYTRAASPPPRPLSAAPPGARMQAAGSSRGAASATESRRERLARLAQPKHASSRHHLQVQRQREQEQQHGLGQAPATAGGVIDDRGEAPAKPPNASQLCAAAALQPAPAAGGCIAAWRPATNKAAATASAQQPLVQQQLYPGSRTRTRSGGSGAPGGGSSKWPQRLGWELDAAELQRATGAYSEERFQRHLSQLSARLAARQAQRQRAADAAAAGVDELVTRVQQLGTGTAAAAGVTACAMPNSGTAAAGAAASTEAAAGQEKGSFCQEPAACDEQAQPAPAEVLPCSAARQLMERQWEDAQPVGSPTERLLSCQERLLRRPLTVPQQQQQGRLAGLSSPERRRPASGSPTKVKSLMQVKGELDRAVAELGARPQRFRASPLPLSTMEPRYQQEVEQREQRRQMAHVLRRQQLLSEQQPFGMDEREAERRERRLLVHGSVGGTVAAAPADAGSVRPATPSAFHAQPVPVATTEV